MNTSDEHLHDFDTLTHQAIRTFYAYINGRPDKVAPDDIIHVGMFFGMLSRICANEAPLDELHLNIPPKSSTPVTIQVTDKGRGMPQVVLLDEEEARGIIALRAALALHNSHLDDTSGPLVVGIGDIDTLLERIQWQVEVLNVYRQAVEEMVREEG